MHRLLWFLAAARAEGNTAGLDESESFTDFFSRLFRADFMPHGHCYFWRPEIVWLHTISDGLIALAYFAIPFMLLHFIRRRKDIPFYAMFYMFGAFIFCCGATHVLSIVTLWEPVYRLAGVMKAITAGVSVATAISLFPLIPKALALRSPKELEEKNRELADAYRTIKKTEYAKDRFFAQVSHELRTPLTLILAPLESLLAEEGTFSDSQKAILQTMHGNALRLLHMVSALLEFEKLGAGKVEVRRRPCAIKLVTQSLLNDFKAVFEQKKLTLQFNCEPADVSVDLDVYLYERILFNLLSNAAKFTPAGGKVSVDVQVRGDRLLLSVQDSGVGISDADLPHLFQRYRQLGDFPARRFEGTGLGLALVKEFAALLGGDVGATTEPGRGTLFRVDLVAPPGHLSLDEGTTRPPEARREIMPPIVEVRPPPDEESKGKPEGPEDSFRSRILVAEDNLELAHYIRTILEPLAQVRLAYDGGDALKQFMSWRPDLILSDVMLPGMDGVELCRAVKSSPVGAGIPVVLLTAQTHREALLRAWEGGADEYLNKPFHPVELTTRLRSLLSLSEHKRRYENEMRRIEELEHFAYFASHDLKEPIRNVIVFSQLLQSRSEQMDATSLEYLQFVIEAAQRMGLLIDELVKYSAVNAEQSLDDRVDCNAVVEQAKENLKTAIAESHAAIRVAHLPTVRGNATFLVQLFQNLLGNALKFRSDEPPQIEITVEESAQEWIFAVKDNGIGFNPEYTERIFVIFKRLHGREQYAGTGVGLAICKRVVEKLGGRIWAESELGKGSTFYFSLPRVPAILAT